MTPRRGRGWPSCSGRRRSWAPSTSGLAWARVSTAVPGFTGATPFGIEVPCTYDLEVAAAKYFYAVRRWRRCRSRFHFNGNVFFHGAGGRLQVVPVPWSCTPQYGMPGRGLAGDDRRALPGRRLGPGRRARRSRRCNDRRGRAGAADASTPASPSCSESRMSTMRERLEQLVSSLLYEGYALYPYTPGATKNATPTPFGIVYPPAYAAECEGAFDHARLECVAGRRSRRGPDRDAALPGAERRTPRGARAARRARAGGRGRAQRRSSSTAGGSRCARSGSPTAGCWSAPACTTRATVAAGLERGDGVDRLADLDAYRGRDLRRALRLAARGWTRERQHLAGARHRRRRRRPRSRDRAARPSADLLLEPRQSVRQHRDRGGARPPRARAQRCGARRRRRLRTRRCGEMLERALATTPEEIVEPARRAERRRVARPVPATAAPTTTPASRRATRRRRHIRARRPQLILRPGHRPRRLRPDARRPARRRSSGSTSTTTTACISA